MVDGTRVEACRSCGSPALRPFLSLGRVPIANALLTVADLAREEPRYPLEVGFCESCTLVQLLFALPADAIFDEAYPYFSSFSEDLLAHAKAHVEGLLAAGRLGPGRLLVEVASNDGYLLRHALERGVPVLGIEPTPGPAAAARALGIPTLQVFFGRGMAAGVRREHGPADVIVANNVMAHVPDLNGFVAGFRELIADDGLITIENPYLRDLIDHAEFDTIYHEHWCYFSCTAVDALMRRHGLSLNDVEYFPRLHGGTLRWHVSPVEARTPRVLAYLDEERQRGLTAFAAYERFGERVAGIADELRVLLARLHAEGATIAAYGATAKGSTLVNFVGIDQRTLAFVADRNPHKQGHWTPGARVPIVPAEALLERQPDYVLLLAWNFADEILRQQAEYRRRGGRFIVPIPSPVIV
ncbi:MAG: methyltransferase [Chloroflexi bacterium RBG_16_72_14]|nr:MAG: methyltransferase [Chloroflexi bacterium RBG_16_72_14]